MKVIKYFMTENGECPYVEWFDGLEQTTQRRIYAYVVRVSLGSARKNVRSLGSGVFEVKINLGPGYRVYFAEAGNTLMLILAGGDKSTQFKDIERAKKYWREYVSKPLF